MPSKLNRPAYERLIQEDIEWLLTMPRTLEREHIEALLRDSANVYYPNGDPWPTNGRPPMPAPTWGLSENIKVLPPEGKTWCRAQVSDARGVTDDCGSPLPCPVPGHGGEEA